MQSFFLELYTYTRYPKISEGTRIWVNHNMNPKPQSRTFWVTSAEVAIFIIFPKDLQTKLQQTLGFASSMLGKKQTYSPNSYQLVAWWTFTMVPYASNHIVREWLGCPITSSAWYFGDIAILRGWLDHTPPRTKMWHDNGKTTLWKMHLLLNMMIFQRHVTFCGCNCALG